MFSIEANKIASSKKKLGLGIHKVKTVSCDLRSVGDSEKKIIEWKFENQDGEVSITEWEPQEGASVREEWEDGSAKASDLDHLLMRVNLIVSSINPTVEQRFEFKDWDDVRNYCNDNFVEGTELDLKLIALVKGEAKINKFIASIDKEGKVYVSKKKRFIGLGLTLDPTEKQKIKQSLEAKPDDDPIMADIEIMDPSDDLI